MMLLQSQWLYVLVLELRASMPRIEITIANWVCRVWDMYIFKWGTKASETKIVYTQGSRHEDLSGGGPEIR